MDSTRISNNEVALIGLTDRMSMHIASLYLSEDCSDITISVGNERVPVHKVVLASCEYFRALLYGGLAESNHCEIKVDADVVAFKKILRYIYFGYLSLADLSNESIFEILGLANMFLISVLADSISNYIERIISLQNVLSILELSRSHGIEILMEACFKFADRRATAVLRHVNFQKLSQESLCDLIKRDTFNAPEMEIFVAVQRWFKENSNVEMVMSLVRLQRMDVDQLIRFVKPLGIVPANRLCDVLELKHYIQQDVLRQEELVTNTNFASTELGLKVISGNLYSGFIGHIMEETAGTNAGIVIRLGSTSTINYIEFLLVPGSYGYVVEVSKNNLTWERVIDHSKSCCTAKQQLYFPARKVLYIRFLGIIAYFVDEKTERTKFAVKQIRAKICKDLPRLKNGFVVPSINVANVEGALVAFGKNGNIRSTIGNIYCTYHNLKATEHILINLNQPYFIGSMRLRLWDLDNQSNRFYVDVSSNDADVEIVFDKRNEDCKSWQTITFERRLVSRIRIFGTHSSTALQKFGVVHFECPAGFDRCIP